MRKQLGFVGLVVVVFGMAGCGGGNDTPELGRVNGTVKLDGAPLPDATVKFQPVAEGRPSTGKTNANGEYTLQYTRDVKGAMIGKHKVSITTGMASAEEPAPEKVPTKYNVKTTLEAEVKAGPNEIHFNDLDSKGDIIQPEGSEKKTSR